MNIKVLGPYQDREDSLKNLVEKAIILQETLGKIRTLVVKIVQDRMEVINNAEHRIKSALDVKNRTLRKRLLI